MRGAVIVPMSDGAEVALTSRVIHHRREHGLRHGLPTMCEGGGTADATLVELAL